LRVEKPLASAILDNAQAMLERLIENLILAKHAIFANDEEFA